MILKLKYATQNLLKCPNRCGNNCPVPFRRAKPEGWTQLSSSWNQIENDLNPRRTSLGFVSQGTIELEGRSRREADGDLANRLEQSAPHPTHAPRCCFIDRRLRGHILPPTRNNARDLISRSDQSKCGEGALNPQ